MAWVVTNAPADYDYWYMEERGTVSLDGHQMRLLWSNDDRRCEMFQFPRYGSGLYIGKWLPDDVDDLGA